MKENIKQQSLDLIYLVNDVADKYNLNSSIVSKEDLFQQGFIGLMMALDTYDKSMELSLEDYATIYIKYYINEIIGTKQKKNVQNAHKYVNPKISIYVKSLKPYFKKMDPKTVNILRMYFDLNNDKVDINYIAFMNCVPTSEIYNIVQQGLAELKYLIETEYKRCHIAATRKDDNVYTYYADYSKENIDLATLLLTNRQQELQSLRFNKETATKEIRNKYIGTVKPRMIFYLEKLESFGSLKDVYIKMMIEKKQRIKTKTM